MGSLRKPVERAPDRLGPLAKLPVFLDLAGKRVIVAGGSDAAAWKAELLAAAGAHVAIYSVAVGEEMTALLSRGAAGGTLTLHERCWAPDVFAGAAIALADCVDEAEAQTFCCAAKAAGVPVNVIDRPRFCEFQFGAIVNRSPVVIGISTDGAAPILGQSIRRRIETLLPASLAAWAELARMMRGEVMRRLPKGPARRAFWERFSARVFEPGSAINAADDVKHLIDQVVRDPATSAGRVTLVGAGPGDAELLTLKAVRALQTADVILFDDLVSADVLELARREAKRMLVGKRGQRDSCRQDDINALMLKLAQAGKHVVRLKSGDPMIFGRAGEEIAELEAAGVPVTVVPGITAAIALAAEVGVSLTHRDCAQSVRFVTGHCRNGNMPELDWAGLADPHSTLLFYMAGSKASAIAARLLSQGLSPQTSVVAASGIGRPNGQRWHGVLSELASWQPFRDGEPVLIAVGRVFGRLARASSEKTSVERAA